MNESAPPSAERCRVSVVKGAVCPNKGCGMEMYATQENWQWPICLRMECLQRYWGGIIKRNRSVARVYAMVGDDWEERWFCFLQDRVMQHGEISPSQAKYWLYHFLYEKDHEDGYVYECDVCGRQYKPASKKCSDPEHSGYKRVKKVQVSDLMHTPERDDDLERGVFASERRALMAAGLDGFTDSSMWSIQIGGGRFEVFRHAQRQVEVPLVWRDAIAYISSRHGDVWALYFMGRVTQSDVRSITSLSVGGFLEREESVIADVATWASLGED